MKRFIALGALAFVVVSLAASVANAAWSDPQDIPWFHQRTWNYGYGTSYYLANGPRADTTWTVGSPSSVDTTVAFHLLDSDLPSLSQVGGVAADTLAFAFLTFVSDSTVSATSNFKAATAAVQVNWGASQYGWTTIKTYTCTNTDGKKFWAVPLFADGVVANADGNTLGIDGIQQFWQFAPAMRVIFSGTTGTAIPQLRCRLIKYKAPGARNQATGNY